MSGRASSIAARIFLNISKINLLTPCGNFCQLINWNPIAFACCLKISNPFCNCHARVEFGIYHHVAPHVLRNLLQYARIFTFALHREILCMDFSAKKKTIFSWPASTSAFND